MGENTTGTSTAGSFIDVSFTKDDFSTTKPYEYLYSFMTDGFTHENMRERVNDMAVAVGFKAFKRVYKKYQDSLRGTQSKRIGNLTDFSKQPLQLESGDWYADDTGIYCDSAFGTVYACSHPIIPFERVLNIDTGMEKIKLIFRKGNEEWRTAIFDKSVIASPNTIIQLANNGISITNENAKHLIKYLQDIENLNYEKIPMKHSVGRLGWIDGYGFSPYVDDLIFDGDSNFRNLFSAVKPAGTIDKWTAIATEMRRKDVSCRIAMAASFASALVKWCDISSFFVHIWTNEAATGKTVMLMVAASVWGDPSFGAYTQSFNATTVSMEMTADFFNSMPLILDELQLAKDTHGNLRFDVYKLAQGLGKGRGKKIGGVERTPSWNLCIMTSGETPITNISDGAGAYARVIEVELDRVIIDAEAGNRIISGIKMNHGHAGKRFIEIMDSIGKDGIKQMFTDKLQTVVGMPDVQEKQAGAAALLLLADDLASENIFHDDSGLTLQELLPYLLSRKQTSINERAYEIIIEWIAANANRFESNTSYTGKADNQGMQYGIIEDDIAYIINSQFNNLMEDNGFNGRSVLSAFRKQGLIETYSDGGKTRNDVRKTINNTRVRCVAVRINIEDDDGKKTGDPFGL